MSLPDEQARRDGQFGQIRYGRMAHSMLGERFTQISNDALRDERLSFKARGVLAWLASHREGFGCSVASIEAASTKERRDAIRAALKELEEFNYLERVRTRDPKTGRLGPADYLVTDMPMPVDNSPMTDNPSQVPMTDNPSLGLTRENDAFLQVVPTNGLANVGKSPTKNTNTKNTSKNTSTSQPHPAYGGERVVDDDDSTGGDVRAAPVVAEDGVLTSEQADIIAAGVQSIRPEWEAPGIRKQVHAVRHLPFQVVFDAFMAAARDTRLHTPMLLASKATEAAQDEARRTSDLEHREAEAEEWRRAIHEDHVNRASEDRAAKLAAKARAELQAAKKNRPKSA